METKEIYVDLVKGDIGLEELEDFINIQKSKVLEELNFWRINITSKNCEQNEEVEIMNNELENKINEMEKKLE